jgi:hypothetical protein
MALFSERLLRRVSRLAFETGSKFLWGLGLREGVLAKSLLRGRFETG